MSVIFGATGKGIDQTTLLAGLRASPVQYDSAGICLLSRNRLRVFKSTGELNALTEKLTERSINSQAGIGHLRWASVGETSEINAHPHTDNKATFAVVHNGVIENADALFGSLVGRGVTLQSSTDSEIIAHLLALSDKNEMLDRIDEVACQLRGAYGFAVVSTEYPGSVAAACRGSTLYAAQSGGNLYVSSDKAVLQRFAEDISPLKSGEAVLLGPRSKIHVQPLQLPQADHPRETTGSTLDIVTTEIQNIPAAVNNALQGRLDTRFNTARLDGLSLSAETLRSIRRVCLLGSGSAWFAAQAGRYMIEHLARLPATAESAGEFQQDPPVIESDTLYICISQSGQTSDTLAAANEIRMKGGLLVALTNAVASPLAERAGKGLYLHAGEESGFVSTKTYANTLASLALTALLLGRCRDLSPNDGAAVIDALQQLPAQLTEVLSAKSSSFPSLSAASDVLRRCKTIYYCGTGSSFPTVQEGAQKLREIAQRHAQVCPLPEIEHGPLALLDQDCVLLAVLPGAQPIHLFERRLQAIQDTGCNLIVLKHGASEASKFVKEATVNVTLPASHAIAEPLIASTAVQLLACQLALSVDNELQPGRLRKVMS